MGYSVETRNVKPSSLQSLHNVSFLIKECEVQFDVPDHLPNCTFDHNLIKDSDQYGSICRSKIDWQDRIRWIVIYPCAGLGSFDNLIRNGHLFSMPFPNSIEYAWTKCLSPPLTFSFRRSSLAHYTTDYSIPYHWRKQKTPETNNPIVFPFYWRRRDERRRTSIDVPRYRRISTTCSPFLFTPEQAHDSFDTFIKWTASTHCARLL